ncbi:MAG: hypothetical protein U0800_21120 [Isosphaeraceae bacterium]
MLAVAYLAAILAPSQLPDDPASFPIAVWLQDPRNAPRYKEAGINLYIGLWKGPTEAQLAALRDAGMRVICAQNAVGLAHKEDPTIAAWMHGDEPDNAQEVTDRETGKKRYGPPIPPARIVADYEVLRKADPSRPVLLNLGQGVANDSWVGRGPDGRFEDYRGYIQGADIVSFDVYPVAGVGAPDRLWLVAKGVNRLTTWADARKPVWACIETGIIDRPDRKPTPRQVEAEVWMALIAGARGLIYFVHQFQPRFNEHALLDDPEMLAAVSALNHRVREMAPALKKGEEIAGARVESSRPETSIALLWIRYEGADYGFAVNRQPVATTGTFVIPGAPNMAAAEVLGEGRTIALDCGKFADEFEPNAVHLYRARNPRGE